MLNAYLLGQWVSVFGNDYNNKYDETNYIRAKSMTVSPAAEKKDSNNLNLFASTSSSASSTTDTKSSASLSATAPIDKSLQCTKRAGSHAEGPDSKKERKPLSSIVPKRSFPFATPASTSFHQPDSVLITTPKAKNQKPTDELHY